MSRLSIGEAIQQVVGILSVAGDTGEVLRAIARAARQMMLADEAYLLLREGGRLVLRAADGPPQEYVGAVSIRAGEGIEGWVADHGEPVALSDVSRERRFRDPPWRQIRVRSIAAVPMRLRDDVVGVLATAGADPFPPTGSRLTGLEILAGIAAVTIENDRLLAQERRRAHQAEVQLELAGIQDLELWPFLQRVADAINSALAVDDTVLMLLDETGQQVACTGRARGSGDTETQPQRGQPPTRLDLAWASGILATGQHILSDDVALDHHLSDEFRRSGARSLLAVPIQVGGKRRGILRVATAHPASFRPEDLTFLTLIAAQVGLSVERAELARRQMEVSREQARQQARQEFLGQVSHELKTPVAVLKAYTELLLRKAEADPSRVTDQDVLGRMLEQTDRMLAMVEQLLDIQKIETGQFSLEVSHFDLTDLARRIAENLQLTTNNHKIRVRGDGRLPVLADRRRVEEVFFNLTDNALKYSPRGGEVVIGISTRPTAGDGEEEALVSVADDGIGIPPQDLERIFDRFYQGQGRFRRGHVGLGLGLYIAKEIVERHGGRIWAESSEGIGSTFYFTLPLATSDE